MLYLFDSHFLSTQPLDDFCKVIKREVRMIIGSKVPKPEDWVFSEKNHPFLQSSNFNAVELSEKTMEEVQEILHEDAQDVIRNYSRSIAFKAKKKI